MSYWSFLLDADSHAPNADSQACFRCLFFLSFFVFSFFLSFFIFLLLFFFFFFLEHASLTLMKLSVQQQDQHTDPHGQLTFTVTFGVCWVVMSLSPLVVGWAQNTNKQTNYPPSAQVFITLQFVGNSSLLFIPEFRSASRLVSLGFSSVSSCKTIPRLIFRT